MYFARIERGANARVYEIAEREATVIGDGKRKRIVEFKRRPWSWRFVRGGRPGAAAIAETKPSAIAAAKCKLGVN